MNSQNSYTYVLKCIFFWVYNQKSKTSSNGTCLGEPPVRFLWCWLSSLFCCCFSFVVALHSHFLLDIIPHPSMDYRQVFTTILYFQPSPLQSDLGHVRFQPFRYLLTATAAVLSGHFLTTGVFYLTLLPDIFWHNLLLSRLPWKPAVIPWNLQGFMLILETQTRPICLFDSQ